MLRKLGWRGQLDAADIVATWGGGWSWAGWWWRAWGTWRSGRRAGRWSGWLLVSRWASRWLATTTASAAPAPGSSVSAFGRATATTFAGAISAAVGAGVGMGGQAVSGGTRWGDFDDIFFGSDGSRDRSVAAGVLRPVHSRIRSRNGTTTWNALTWVAGGLEFSPRSA
jgi:hypothetical protein